MIDTGRGRGRGRSRGGGTHQQQYRSEESLWTVKHSSDQKNSTEIFDDNRRTFRSESGSPKPSSSKASFRVTDGGGRNGERGRNWRHGKGEFVGDEGVVEIEVGRREEEGVDVNGRAVEEEEKVGEESGESCELGKDEDVIVRRLEELRLGFQEAELSEEEFSVNDQLQKDEVVY